MASTASTDDTPAGSQRAPLSSHPAFTPIVALWFAALLGVGTLVVPGSVIERGIGVASVAPAAAAPLGTTARALIALACGLAGLAAGLVIANLVKQRNAAPSAARVINAHEDLGEARFDGAIAPPDAGETEIAEPIAEESDEAPAELFPRQVGAERRGGSRRVADEPVALDLRVGPRRIDELPSAFAAPRPASRAPDESAALAELGLVQLVERLGMSLAARRALLGNPAGTASGVKAEATSEPSSAVSESPGLPHGDEDGSDDTVDRSSFGSLLQMRRTGLTTPPEDDEWALARMLDSLPRLDRSA